MGTNSVVIIAGPSGVGKTEVAKAIIAHDSRFTFLRSATTRAKRGDAHDDEYLYCTKEEFLDLIDSGKMLEHMVYDGNMYGTPHSEVERAHNEGKIPLLVLDLNGVEALYHHPLVTPCAVYLYAEGSVVDGRLSGRDGSSPEKVESRKRRNKEDFLRLPTLTECFYAVVPNVTTVAECRDAVISSYSDFERGAPKSENIPALILEISKY